MYTPPPLWRDFVPLLTSENSIFGSHLTLKFTNFVHPPPPNSPVMEFPIILHKEGMGIFWNKPILRNTLIIIWG